MSKRHIGEILDSVAENHALSKVEIIQIAGYASQSTYYKHIVQSDLPFKILYKYAKAMRYSFSKEIPDFEKWLKSNNLSVSEASNEQIESLIFERDKWKDRYYELMSKYNALSDKYNTLLEKGK